MPPLEVERCCWRVSYADSLVSIASVSGVFVCGGEREKGVRGTGLLEGFLEGADAGV